MKQIFITLLGMLLCAQITGAQTSVFDKHRVAFKKADDKVQLLLIGDSLFRFYYKNDLVDEVQFQKLNTSQAQKIHYGYENLLIKDIQYPAGTISVLRDSGRAKEIQFPNNETIRLRYSKGEISNIELNQTYSVPVFRDKKGKLIDPKYDTSTNARKARLSEQLALYNWLRNLTDINGILDNHEYYQNIFSGVQRLDGKESFSITALSQTELSQLQKSFPVLMAESTGASPFPKDSTATAGSSNNCCPRHVAIALEVGANLANMQNDTGSNSYKGEMKTGIRAGLNIRIPVGKSLFIEPGLYYVQQGMTGLYGSPNRRFKDVSLNYAEIPINIDYILPAFGVGCFDFGIGGHFGYAFSGKGTLITTGPSQTLDLKFGSDVNSDFSQIDYGAQVSAGYILRNGIYLRIGYQHGFANIIPADLAENSGDKTTNRSWSFTLGYEFGRRR